MSVDLHKHNPHLAGMSDDALYHLGLNRSDDLQAMFGGVKHVAMMGSADRAQAFAVKLHQQLGGEIKYHGRMPKFRLGEIGNIAGHIANLVAAKFGRPVAIGKEERFSMFQVGDTISVSHGMGQPSHSILLHELTKMLFYARAKDFKYYRLGTSGGVGVEPGTVVVAKNGLDPTGEARYKLHVCGEEVELPTEFDPKLAEEIMACRDQIEAVMGNTMSADDFYTVQARLDGAFCYIDEAKKMEYLHLLHDKKEVRNIEMEAAAFAAFCQKLGIPAACLCVALLNRLEGDQVTPEAQKRIPSFADNPQQMLINYIRKVSAANEGGAQALAA